MEKKKNNVLFILLVCVVALIIAFLIICIGKKDSKNVECTCDCPNIESAYTFDVISGVYEGKGEQNHVLIMYDNGTYWYLGITMVAGGDIGNYIIKDNTITLNKWFTSGSGAALYATKGINNLTINDDNSITLIDEVTKENIILTKVSSDKANEYITNYNITAKC